MSLLINPTGRKVRESDPWGKGTWHAPRGKKLHKGVDFTCEVGQEVLSPCVARVVRLARPYANDDVLEGVLLASSWITIKMFYLRLDRSLIGQEVVQGQVLGFAQDITGRYRGMTPHIHLQVDGIDPLKLIDR